jgi:hypothetical protein
VPNLSGEVLGGDGHSLVLVFIMPSAATFITDFAQVQLEQSDTASVFEPRTRAYEIERCQRYFEIHAGVMASAVAATETVTIPINLASIVGSGDVLTTYTPGYAFKILSVDFAVSVPATTGSKAASLNLEIGTTDLTGGVVALTSANSTPLGVKVAGSAVTATNTGTSSDTISVESSGVTAFSEGAGYLLLKIQNLELLSNIKPCYYFATRKLRAPTIAFIGTPAGTGGAFTALLDIGYYQSAANSVVAAFFISAEAELFPDL